jgi:hypothetical protein
MHGILRATNLILQQLLLVLKYSSLAELLIKLDALGAIILSLILPRF